VETLRAKTPVFTDESGRRLSVLQWMVRGLCACFVLVGAAIAFTLVTHVPLPGLGGLLPPPTTDRAPQVTRDEPTGGERALDTGLTPESDTGSGAGAVAGRVDGNTRASMARPLSVATAGTAPQGAAASEEGSGSVATPQPQATATASPSSNTPPSQSNANPHATAKSANSTVRATPQATKSKNANATTGKANGQSSSRQTSTPSGRTK